MQIIWDTVAIRNLEEAELYIAQYDKDAASRVKKAVLAAVERLAEVPDLGRPGRVDETREWVVSHTPYIIAYTVMGDTLIVLSVLPGAREWPEDFGADAT